ncbi:MAG: hypothetical protein C4526_08975 [Nitrospiraceae bacterium]|nr:MAG: hypothetical protein C4526_08975 [Nitrospiraceae bacterium]
MKQTVLVLIVGFLLIASNLFAADGDLIVEGNVGIGTASPSNALHVESGTALLRYPAGNNTLLVRNSGAMAQVRILTTNASGGSQIRLENADSDVWDLSLDSAGLMSMVAQGAPHISFTALSSIHFNKDNWDVDVQFDGDVNDNLLYLDAGLERVGIGTAAPAEKLEVAGAVKVSNTASQCSPANAGTIKFESPDFKGCNGTEWVKLNN